MRNLLTYIALLSSFAPFAQNGLYNDANTLYNGEDYEGAIELYQEELNTEGLSSEVYYNLGNCYFRTGEITNAIYHYERALKLEPGDENTLHNLSLCYARTIDKIEPLPEFALTAWYKNFALGNSTDTWAALFLIALFVGAIAMSMFMYTRKLGAKRILFFGGGFLGFIAVLLLLISFSSKNILTNAKNAVIFEPSLTVHSAPTDNSEKLFVLHEGTKVTIISKSEDWCEVTIPNGNRGWAPTVAFKEI